MMHMSNPNLCGSEASETPIEEFVNLVSTIERKFMKYWQPGPTTSATLMVKCANEEFHGNDTKIRR